MSIKHVSPRHSLIAGYAEMVRSRLALGFSPYIHTFAFKPFNTDGEAAAVEQMGWLFERSFTMLATRFIREPRRLSPNALPLMLGMPDLPIIKWRKVKRLASINDGLHAHAIYLLPPKLRNGVEPQEVFTKVNKQLCDACRLMTFDARPLTDTPDQVVAYVLKSLSLNRFDEDRIWIFPKAKSELSSRTRARGGKQSWADPSRVAAK